MSTHVLTHGCALSNLPLFVAAGTGLFERHGLDVTLSPIDQLTETGEMMRTGESELGTAAFSQVLVDAYAENAPVVVAGSGVGGLAVLTREPATEPWAGMAIGTFRGDPMEVLVHDWLAAHGLGMDDVDVREVGSIAGALAAWESGELDAMSLAEPFAGRLVAEGAHVATDGTDLWAEEYPDTVLVVSRGLLERDPGAVSAAISAMRDAERLIREDPAAAVAHAAHWYPGMSVAELVDALDRQPPKTDIRHLREVILGRWSSVQSLGLVDADAPRPEGLVDFSLLSSLVPDHELI
jgi:NitT/TauT family transport system substrate-binding protein